MKSLGAAHNRAKAIIKSCVESGAGIDFLPDAPTFRYTPATDKPLHHGKPSARGGVKVACSSRNCACKHSLWYRHEPLSADPMYAAKVNWNSTYLPVPLTDTDADEADAKLEWAKGNPGPLRELLAERAKARRQAAVAEPVQLQLEAA